MTFDSVFDLLRAAGHARGHDGVPSGPTVLLVENSREDRQRYAEYLRVHRFRVLELTDSAKALVSAPAIDVVITGITLQGPFDGIELVRRLRADDRTSRKPIIVTAPTFEGNRQRAHGAGCDAFLPKPCLPNMLVPELRSLAARGTSGSR